jgi:YfiH family protein
LNFSSAGGDSPEAVAENLSRAATDLGITADQIFYLSQVHGRDARVLTGDEALADTLRSEGDITLSSHDGVGCGVRMADCPAVLIGDSQSGAVAAVHSGWRGTVAGAAPAGVEALRGLVGAPGELVAAIGPCIEQCCFEVGDDVAQQIAAASELGDDIVDRSRPKAHVDLRRVIEAQLRAVGVEQVDQVAGCTMCDPERFHSYRRDGVVSGRMLAVIAAGVRRRE